MNSTYSIRLYELLKERQLYKQREFTIEKLREHFGLSEKQYPAYGNLKQRIIKPAVEEINSKTDILVDFTETKKGRKVDKVKFSIKANKQSSVQIELFDEDEDTPPVVDSKIRHELKKLKVSFEDQLLKSWEQFHGEDDILKLIEYVKSRGKEIANPEKYIHSILQGPIDEKNSMPKIEQALKDLYDRYSKITDIPASIIIRPQFYDICHSYEIEESEIKLYWKQHGETILDTLTEMMKQNRRKKR